MSTELLDLQLAFRALSDEEDVDGVETDDVDLKDDDLEDLDDDGADNKSSNDDEQAEE